MTEEKRKSKAVAPKTELFAMRFDPRIKYLAEIAARKQRRSLSNFMEWAVELGLMNTFLVQNSQVSVLDMSNEFWDVIEADRFVKLAYGHPELLSFHEQLLWKVICERGNLWKGKKDSAGNWRWKTDDVNKLSIERLRRKWDLLKSVASGEIENSVLIESEKNDTELDMTTELWDESVAEDPALSKIQAKENSTQPNSSVISNTDAAPIKR